VPSDTPVPTNTPAPSTPTPTPTLVMPTATVNPGVPCGPALIGLAQGLLVRTTPLYWAPRKDATSTFVVEAGKTFWVLGVDSTRSFYKIVLACKTYWVPIETLVPNPDDVWRGAPLPTQVVN
ncbi:MAG: hypothetical protein J7551_07365, partial [Chloroflexi bacterium]|nr:hypothetical protein [Chloroflexota bacterium]